MNEEEDTPNGEFRGESAIFQYNVDLTGSILVRSLLPGQFGEEIEMDAEDLINFIAEAYVRPRLIECIKKTPAKDLLLNQLHPLDDGVL